MTDSGRVKKKNYGRRDKTGFRIVITLEYEMTGLDFLYVKGSPLRILWFGTAIPSTQFLIEG